MEHQHATLWKGELDGIPVAIFECELPRPIRRRVLLGVDSTDSCWQADCAGGFDRLQPEIHALLSSLSRVVEPGDECSIWLFGRTEPAFRMPISTGSFWNCCNRRLAPVPSGQFPIWL